MSHIIYKGRSMLDGSPIVVIATGIKRPSKNGKTGPVVQTWILADNGQTPMASSQSGADASVCGKCPHRAAIRKAAKAAGLKPAAECYVDLSKAPRAIMRAYLAGKYIDISNDPAAISALMAGKIVRAGAYGDPCAAPARLWRDVYKLASGRTGYSHQWHLHQARGLAQFAMASVDSPAERDQAKAKGWRTFRVKSASEPVLAGEIVCPASSEAGNKTTCKVCQYCNGWSALGRTNRAVGDVVINNH
jgi:hypothetical protein